MSTFQTKKFITDQIAKGRKPEEIQSFLEKKGFDPTKESQEFSRGAGGFIKGAVKSVASIPFDLGALGAGIQKGVSRGIESLTGARLPVSTAFDKKPEMLESVGPTEKSGETAGILASFLAPGGAALRGTSVISKAPKAVVGATRAAGDLAGRAAGATGRTAGEVVLGSKGARATSQAFSKPKDVMAFKEGKASIQTIADRTNEAIDAVRKTSKDKFDSVVENLPGNKVPRSQTLEQLRSDIVENLGISGQKLTLRNLTSAGMSDQESSVVLRLYNRIRAHSDWTDKGVVKLRQSLDKGGFYKAGNPDYAASNRVISRVRRALNEAAGNASGREDLKKALAEAADDIDLMEQLGYTVRGTSFDKNVEATASRLESLIRNIDDPTKRQATIDLISKLQERTGLDVGDLLRSLSSARQTTGDLPGIRDPFGLLQTLLTRGAGKAAELSGRATGQQAKSQLFSPIRPSPIARPRQPLPKGGQPLYESMVKRYREAGAEAPSYILEAAKSRIKK